MAPLIGAPFLAKGGNPEGWDCRGCVHWCLRILCGVEVPDYLGLYSTAMVSARGRHDRARLLAEGLNQWRPVEPQAGAVAWLEWLGAAGHVGFMLSPTRILHADVGVNTALLDLDRPGASYRLRGAFAPAHISQIVHAEA